MNGFYTVVITVCGASLICAIVSNFVTDGSIKKILNLVLGAFVVCSMILPVKNAVSNFNLNIDGYRSADELTASYDEAYNIQIISQTKENLEQTLRAILSQNGIEINDCEIILANAEDNSIIISGISIYINKAYYQNTDLITELTTQNFGIMPSIITE